MKLGGQRQDHGFGICLLERFLVDVLDVIAVLVFVGGGLPTGDLVKRVLHSDLQSLLVSFRTRVNEVL